MKYTREQLFAILRNINRDLGKDEDNYWPLWDLYKFWHGHLIRHNDTK